MNKKTISSATISLFTLIALGACAGKTAKVSQDPSVKYAVERSFEQAPEELQPIVEKVLDKYIEESDPSVENKIRIEKDKTLYSTQEWVYGKSKDKYVLVDFNGAPRRKEMRVRRKFTYAVMPAVIGTKVGVKIEEQIETLDKKTGKPVDWEDAKPDTKLHEKMLQDLVEMVRAS